MLKINESVKLESGGSFTQEHADTNRENLRAAEKRYPEMYDREHLKELGLIHKEHCSLVETKLIQVESNTEISKNDVRAGGVNAEMKNLHSSLEQIGYLLKHPAICIYEIEDSTLDGKKTYELLDGRTRFDKLREYEYKNVICEVYGKAPDATDQEANIGKDILKAQANFSGATIRGVTKEQDVIAFLHSQMKKGNISCNSKGGASYSETLEMLETTFKNYKYRSQKRRTLAQEAINTYNNGEGVDVKFWKDSKTVKKWAASEDDASLKQNSEFFLQTVSDNKNKSNVKPVSKIRKYIDSKPVYHKETGVCISEGVKYLFKDTDQPRLTVLEAAELGVKFPDHKIRIVAFIKETETINTVGNFNKKRDEFVDNINTIIINFSNTFFNNAKKINCPVEIYGILPSIASVHNLDELILYDKSADCWFQKNPLSGIRDDAFTSHKLNEDMTEE